MGSSSTVYVPCQPVITQPPPWSGFTGRRQPHQLHASDLTGSVLSRLASGLLLRRGCVIGCFPAWCMPSCRRSRECCVLPSVAVGHALLLSPLLSATRADARRDRTERVRAAQLALGQSRYSLDSFLT